MCSNSFILQIKNEVPAQDDDVGRSWTSLSTHGQIGSAATYETISSLKNPKPSWMMTTHQVDENNNILK